MEIDEEALSRLAKISRIDLTAAEVEKLRLDLNAVLEWAGQLSEIDLYEEREEPVLRKEAVFRQDKAVPFSDQDLLVKNFPSKEGRILKVPRFL